MLDYFYGLKETHRITSFNQLFDEIGFDEPLKEASVKDADALIYRLISDFISDGHSNFLSFSYLSGPLDYSATDMTRSRIFAIEDRQKEVREKYYPDGIPGYEEVGNTAYITFDGYYNYLQPNDYYEMDPEDYPEGDVIGLIIKAHQQITRENSPIKNVVLDMSANTGGSDNVSAFVVAWMLGEATASFVDTMTGAMSTSTYRADVNLDRVFDETDTMAGYNLFCLTSSASFSNGNYVPCALKASGKVTLLGRATSGGACTVLPASTAWGTSFRISSNQCKALMKNGAFYDIDRGTEPDYVFPTIEQYYDRADLTDYINDLCRKTSP
jgi:C-terminal processing protease CtpA/Prc